MALHVDLARSIREENGETIIDHSALYFPGYNPGLDDVVNEQYEDVKAQIDDARQRGDWQVLIEAYPWRRHLSAFCQLAPSLTLTSIHRSLVKYGVSQAKSTSLNRMSWRCF